MKTGVYGRFKKRLNITENGIVGFWDLVTKVLSYVSLLVIVLEIKKRWNRHTHKEKTDCIDSIYSFIEIWVVAHVFIAIFASAIIFYDLTPDNRILLN